MPVPAMAEPVVDHRRRFQAAVDVIHNLPKNGSYRPSYEVMLRFYSLYKQAVCGPCTAPRPGFWDPVGRYKWDAWQRLGGMSTECAMAAYVEEMKRVAQEVIDTMPVDEKAASLLHHFEPLYLVIDDMPRPPEALLLLRDGVKSSEEAEPQQEGPEPGGPGAEDTVPLEGLDPTADAAPDDSGVSEGLALTSDSESEVFCDSVDSVEQLGSIKGSVFKCNGLPNGHRPRTEARQAGAGRGGEGGDDGKGPGPARRSGDAGRDGSRHAWREGGVPPAGPRRGGPGHGGGGPGGGGQGLEAGPERAHDVHLQQQIILALRRLREDMRSVMERLEVVERLAATHAPPSHWTPCLQCQQQEERWWPVDVSPQTLALLLLWPFAAQGLVHLLGRTFRGRPSS